MCIYIYIYVKMIITIMIITITTIIIYIYIYIYKPFISKRAPLWQSYILCTYIHIGVLYYIYTYTNISIHK